MPGVPLPQKLGVITAELSTLPKPGFLLFPCPLLLCVSLLVLEVFRSMSSEALRVHTCVCACSYVCVHLYETCILGQG